MIPVSVLKELKDKEARKIFVQYPDGLTLKIVDISKKLEKEGFEPVLCAEPTFGACDMRDDEAKRLGCDVILHIGHSDFGIKSLLPVVYWDYLIEVDPLPILEKEIEKLEPYKRIGLVTSLQYAKVMVEVKDYLETNDKEVHAHKTLKYHGQMLGCCTYPAEAIQDKVDAFLYVGTGKFHPLGVAVKTDKPTFSLDLERKQIISLEDEKMKYLKKKAWHESQLADANKVGIIVSWKKGQNRIDEARKMKEKLEKEGKQVTIIAFDRVSKDKLEGLKFDAIVSMVCPRFDDEFFL